MPRYWFAGALGAALAISGTAQASFTFPENTPGQFAPRDECGEVPGAAKFRKALGDAARRRDANALVALSSPDILLDYGGGMGREELGQRLTGEDGEERWSELEELLGLGCAYDSDELMFPWFYAQDLGDVDPYDTWLVTGVDVPLLPRPEPGARPLRKLSWQLVSIGVGFDFELPYQPVKLHNTDIAGYVETVRLRSQADYRVIAERNGEAWQIAAFIAGD